MAQITFTPNLRLQKLPSNYRVWADNMNSNLTMIDAFISGFIQFNNLRGTWANSTEYNVGDTVVDGDTAVLWTCAVSHLSSMIPTTFLQDRTTFPTYWSPAAAAASARGAWQPNTAYNRNDFVLADGTKYAFCLVSHTSSASFSIDLAAGNWSVLVDLSIVGSLVLPVLSGAADANKVVMTDAGGNSYVINAIAFLSDLIKNTGSTGSNDFVLDTAPTISDPVFTGNPTGPTPAVEDFGDSLATTEYADRAVRNIVIRRQVFTSSGTYTPHSKMVYCDVELVGGGGGGGGAATSGASTGAGAGGGGAGGYSRRVLSRTQIGVSQTVTVGTGGSGGSAGNNAGSAGGQTSLGALCVANGASGGSGAASGGFGAGGVGATTGSAVGDITLAGSSGGPGLNSQNTATVNSTQGSGGLSFFAGGALVNRGQAAGLNALLNSGSGGGGGSTSGAVGNVAGGNGGDGIVIITEFCYG